MLEFKPIDFSCDFDTCVKFREDSFRASFPGSNQWQVYWDEAQYRDWIIQHTQRFPEGAIHIFWQNEIIGQLEFAYFSDYGYINLYYLIEPARGKGYGQLAHAYIRSVLEAKGCKTADLRVSPGNNRAVNFYRKLGARDCGQDPANPHVHIYQFDWR